jgi:hypothetical protein
MYLHNRADELNGYLNSLDAIAATQFQANPLLVTTAVSPTKTDILQPDGVIDKLVQAIRNNDQNSGVIQSQSDIKFEPLTPDQFTEIHTKIQERSSRAQLPIAVAGLSKAMNVEQAFGQTTPGRYTFILKLSEPAPAGGAVFRLEYDGAAVYGQDYVIDSFTSRPEYIHIASGQMMRTLTLDVSDAENPSSLLLALHTGSSNYAVSDSFNRLLVEIAGREQGGGAILRDQPDNVRLILKDGIGTLKGESIFDGMDIKPDTATSKTIGTQPSPAEAQSSLVSLYESSLNSDIQTIINNSESIKKAKRDSVKKEPNSDKRKELSEAEKEQKSLRKKIQEKLIKFATRIPVFMYLTDFREHTLKDVISKLEPNLFYKVTGLTIKDFDLLVSLGVFNSSLMNDAVYKFKRYEDSSLVYTGIDRHEGEKIGLYDTVISREEFTSN